MRSSQKHLTALAISGLLANVAGCDSNEAKTQRYIQSVAANSHPVQKKSFRRKVGDLDILITYRFKNDVILSQTTEDTTPYRILPANNRIEAQAKMEKIALSYQALKGISQRIEYQDNHAREQLTIDFTQANIRKLCELTDITVGMIITNCKAEWLTMSRVETFLREQKFNEVK